MRRSTALKAAAALLLLLLLLAAALAAVNIWYGKSSEEAETRRIFRNWMARMKKKYVSVAEEEHRYAVFKENIRDFDKRNGAAADADTRFFRSHFGLNVFGDLTDEELRSLYNGCADRVLPFKDLGTGGPIQAVCR